MAPATEMEKENKNKMDFKARPKLKFASSEAKGLWHGMGR